MKAEHMIPNIYEQSSDMRVLCRFIDAESEILEYYTNHILDCYSPEHCPQHLLTYLAEHIGFDYQELKSVMYNRVVLKNFIRNLIRYRGSATGIRNAAAIDIRYRQTYDNGNLVPMVFHEAIDIDRTWVDIDADAQIIYLFVVASDYFPAVTSDMSDTEKQSNYEERMRRLLDLAYLQEYVRPAGMYLLPMVAKKVNPKTDLTVKSVRIPNEELNHLNAALGIPNASMQHAYDRMLFASVDNPDEELSIEPWVRTLYHSQVAGSLNNQYFMKPVYHIEGKFLYYEHAEFLSAYQEIMNSPEGTDGLKVGDSLYNPNIPTSVQDFSYGSDLSNEPMSLQSAGKAGNTNLDLPYIDPVWMVHGDYIRPRTYQTGLPDSLALPVLIDPSEEYPIYLDANLYTNIPDENYHSYLESAYIGTHSVDDSRQQDNGTNKNFMINLFTVDEEGNSEWTGISDVHINGKSDIPVSPVPYDIATNGSPDGDNMYWRIRKEPGEEEPQVP